MKEMNDPRGPEWLESALSAWAESQPLSETRFEAVAMAAQADAAPEFPFEWWRTIFPTLRKREAHLAA